MNGVGEPDEGKPHVRFDEGQSIMSPIVKTRKILCKLSSFPCLYMFKQLDDACHHRLGPGIDLQLKNGDDRYCTPECIGSK